MGKKDEEKIEYVGIAFRMLFLVFGAIGLTASILTLSGCNMFSYEPRVPPSGVEDNRPDRFLNLTYAEIGLFKYNPNNEGCRGDIAKDVDNLSWQFKVAQVTAPLAFILASAALFCLVLDFCLCRFSCSRMLIASLYVAAFICQSLQSLVFSAEICEPNYSNGPYPCSPQSATWLMVTATVLFFFCSILSCCVTRPVPLVIRARDNMRNEKNEGCCAIWGKKEKVEGEGEDEKETEEEPEEEEVKALTPEVTPLTPEEIEDQKTRAAVTTALATARRGKLDEIERELMLLEKYKKQIDEEEYNAKVAVLVAALPDPENYDAFTKTRDLVVLPEKEEERKHGDDVEKGSIGSDEGREEGVEVEEGEEAKKSRTGSAVAAFGSAIARPFKSKTEPQASEVPMDLGAES